MSASDPNTRAVKLALMKRDSQTRGASHLDDVTFTDDDTISSPLSGAIYVGSHNNVPVHCHLIEDNSLYPRVQLVREQSLDAFAAHIPLAKCGEIDLIEPLAAIFRQYPGGKGSTRYISAFLRACFIARGFITCDSMTSSAQPFIREVEKAVDAIEGQRDGSTNTTSFTPTLSESAQTQTPSIGSRLQATSSASSLPPVRRVPAARVEELPRSKDDEPIRQSIIDEYSLKKRSWSRRKQELDMEHAEHRALAAKLERLQADIDNLQGSLLATTQEADVKKRKMETIADDVKEKETSLKRLRKEMTGEEGYALARQEMDSADAI